MAVVVVDDSIVHDGIGWEGLGEGQQRGGEWRVELLVCFGEKQREREEIWEGEGSAGESARLAGGKAPR